VSFKEKEEKEKEEKGARLDLSVPLIEKGARLDLSVPLIRGGDKTGSLNKSSLAPFSFPL
jgi:hypothetical protein